MAISVTLRSVKGSPLTIAEVDTNFSTIATAVNGQDSTISGAVNTVNGMSSTVSSHTSELADHENRITALETGGGGGGGLSSVSFFSASKNANQTVISGAVLGATKVSYNLESADSDGAYDPSTSVFTAPSTGWYFLKASLRLDVLSSSNPSGILAGLSFKANGGSNVLDNESTPGSLTGHTIEASGLVYLTAGTYIETYFQHQISGGSLTWQLTSGSTKSYFQAWKIHD